MVASTRKGKTYAKLKKLAVTLKAGKKPTSKDIDTSFIKAAALLKGMAEHARFQIKLIDSRTTANWCLTLTEEICTVSRTHIDRPEIEIITHEDTYWRLATGDLSPVEAFLAGKMEVIGDCKLLFRIYQKLATKDDSSFRIFGKEVT